MALTAKDFFRAAGGIGGLSTQIMEVTKESATTWVKGAIIIATSGYAVEATDGPTTGTILGVAADAAVADKTTALIYPALPDTIFEGRMATGDTGATYTTAQTDLYIKGYGVSLDSTGTWYINQADTTDDAVMIIGFVDAVGTAWGKVRFVFIDSVFNAV